MKRLTTLALEVCAQRRQSRERSLHRIQKCLARRERAGNPPPTVKTNAQQTSTGDCMKLAKFGWMMMMLVLAATLASCGKQEEAKVDKAATEVKAKAEADAKELEARETAIEAYIYAYPLVTMEMTR